MSDKLMSLSKLHLANISRGAENQPVQFDIMGFNNLGISCLIEKGVWIQCHSEHGFYITVQDAKKLRRALDKAIKQAEQVESMKEMPEIQAHIDLIHAANIQIGKQVAILEIMGRLTPEQSKVIIEAQKKFAGVLAETLYPKEAV